MHSRYLCQQPLSLLSVYPELTEQFLFNLIDEGNEAIKSQNFQQAADCFAAAYEASEIILEQKLLPSKQLEITSQLMHYLLYFIKPTQATA